MKPIRLLVAPATASATNIAASQSPGSSALTLTALAAGPIDSCITGASPSGKAMGLGRILTITSGGNDTGIHFTVVGTDQNGVAVTENVTGASGAAAVTVNYYTSVTSITPSGAVASTATVGTVNTTASARLPIIPLDFYLRIGSVVQVDVTGTISYTVQQTFDDCLTAANLQSIVSFATPAAPTALTAQSTSKYTQLIPGVRGLDITIPTYSASGSILVNVVAPTNNYCG